MALHIRGASVVCLALTIAVLSLGASASDAECELVEPSVQDRSNQQSLLQRALTDVHPHTKGDTDSKLVQPKAASIGDHLVKGTKRTIKTSVTTQQKKKKRAGVQTAEDLSWTTNVGQKHHNCSGSHFKMDFTGTHNGMVLEHGLILKKGKCPRTNSTKPLNTQALSCGNKSTGCHMWCAPVWQSHGDTLDWSAFDSRCSKWDGSFQGDDTTCAKAGHVFTWARAELAPTKNHLDLTFAMVSNCTQWCSPLWVTVYDPRNWAKSFRWCFNKKDEWGVCDRSDEVSLDTWHDKEFSFTLFMEKHGYTPEHFVVEFAVYAEFKSAEVLINSLKVSHVAEITTKNVTLAVEATEAPKTCGGQQSCSDDRQCCRKGDSEVDAKCCPKDWSCCEDSCCPAYYTCSITEFGHTCKPPTNEQHKKPELCSL